MTDAVSLIRAKRDGQRLADDDIRWLFDAYARHEVADEQMSALLMAIYFRGLDRAELRTWTAAMIASGDRLDLSSVGRPTVDKHSTGGVGDKVSLILAPLVAACGAAVPQLSGRGLGHTGGTLDKLDSIPGFRSALTPDETLAVLASAGCVICAAGSGLAPADHDRVHLLGPRGAAGGSCRQRHLVPSLVRCAATVGRTPVPGHREKYPFRPAGVRAGRAGRRTRSPPSATRRRAW